MAIPAVYKSGKSGLGMDLDHMEFFNKAGIEARILLELSWEIHGICPTLPDHGMLENPP